MVQSSHSQLCKINSCFVKLDGGPLDHNSGKVLVENSRILILQNNFKNLFLNDKKNATQGTVQFAEAVVPRCSVKKVFLEISQKTWSAILLKMGAWLRCFPVNFAKFLIATFLIEHLRWEHLLLGTQRRWNTFNRKEIWKKVREIGWIFSILI